MTLYSVYARPDQAPAVVADRFSWFAALLPPVFALLHGLWLLLFAWVAIVLGTGVIGSFLGWDAAFWTYVLLALLIGFEAPTFRRVKLGRKGWQLSQRSRRLRRGPRPARGGEAAMSTVAIIDYGSGNLRSAAKAFERAAREAGTGDEILVTSDVEAVRRADRIVLPGVGAFADCRAGLDAVTGMVEVLEERVIRGGTPFLGICVGMQLMATEGREKTTTKGLGWIPGAVVRLEPSPPETGAQGPAHGLEHPELRACRTRCLPASRTGRTACTPISSTPTISRSSGPKRCSPRPTTASGDRHRRPRQHGGHPVPPRKEPVAGLTLIGNFLRWKP